MKIKTEQFLEYLSLKNEIDIRVKKLEANHKKHMKCKSGCDLCCMDYNIFPVEFYSILNDLKNITYNPKESKNPSQSEESCIFLQNHRCTIYESRPIICRTHGLPLLFTNEEGEWELSACELNFTEFDFAEFNTENTFPQDIINSKLFLLNKKFISENPELNLSEFDLIPLKNLVQKL
jgi:Fe-S-cluster containining protein